MSRRFANDQTLRNFLRRCKNVVDDCVRVSSTDVVQPETVNNCIRRLEMVERSIERAATQFSAVNDNLLPKVREMLFEFRKSAVMDGGAAEQTAYKANKMKSAHGPPVYGISKPQLEFLLSCGFSSAQISTLLGVSAKTVQRRLREFRLSSRYAFTDMSDAELDETVRQHIQCNDRIGPNAIRSMLMAEGIKIQRQRVRDSMLRVNSLGVALRSVHRMQRRSYRVAGPNSLWHIDGNHKLIRWRFVIHGGIDGFSRLIVFLHASDNNRQDTVLQHFIAAIAQYGTPSRIRVDDGGENNAICALMQLVRGADHNAAIRGASVHNQRIERFWRDMWNGVTNVFYNLFYYLEHHDFLDSDNEQNLWALHYVFLPRINAALYKFMLQWNNHSLRTEHNQSPLQLFVGQALHLSNSSLAAVQDLFRTVSTTASNGVDGSASSLVDENESFVSIPAVTCPLSSEQLSALKDLVDPTDNTADELGVTQYLKTVAFLTEINV